MMGSRFLGGQVRAGGMPAYKIVANRFLTICENVVLGLHLSEAHTGFRAYSREMLCQIPFLLNSDYFVFDSQVIAQAVAFGFRIGEIGVPTRYFDEASSVNFRRSVVYGLATLWTLLKFLLHKWGLARMPQYSQPLREVVGRHYGKEEQVLPDLLVVDGGKGQLSAAVSALNEIGLEGQAVASIAKREEILFVKGSVDSPIELPKDSPVLHLIQTMRNEAHRFAVTYHRKRRELRDFDSELMDVPGIGEVTAKKLLAQHGRLEDLLRNLSALPAKWRNPLTEHREERVEGVGVHLGRERRVVIDRVLLGKEERRHRIHLVERGRHEARLLAHLAQGLIAQHELCTVARLLEIHLPIE